MTARRRLARRSEGHGRPRPDKAVPPPAPSEPGPSWGARLPMVAGLTALVLLVGGLGAWSVQARIAGAVVTSGMIQVESNRQVVQHPEGGVVGAILVREGDSVAAGDVLVRLDGSRQQAEFDIVEGQLRELAARQARLRAERDGDDEIRFDPTLLALAAADPQVAENVAGERALFTARLEAMAQEARLLDEQNTQIDNRVAGIEAQLSALGEQFALMDTEVENQESLLARQLTQAARVSELQRERAGLRGQIGRLEAEIAELRGQAARNEIARLQLETRRREEAVTGLRDLQFREIELMQRRQILQETLSRLDIRAPVSGLVYDSRIFALQSVIRPADPLMYIVPQDQPLVVQARVEALAIDQVHRGQEASLQFSAFDLRQTPEVIGVVTRISADAITEERTGISYYAIEILPLEGELAKLEDAALLPGMPVEVFLQTGERSPLTYLTQPLTSYFNRAFRE